ncbi:queuosine precursor transporter [Nesterenkonia sp.]|uniref:queuosine precursor transporter n=1 Tax=Nesterenkonia sp. TaxID=704201 RepID=UPI00261C61BE|nr:queuosine precursor transporter [Nesterenkonia sp.]
MSTPVTPFAQVGSRFYPTLLALLAAFYLISNIAATKTMAFDLGFAEWVVDGGVFLFPLTYLIGGLIAEVYGFRAAFRAVLVGFSVMVIGAVVFGLVTASPATEGAWNQEAFEILFGWDGVYLRILVASLLAFLAGQLVNAVVIVRIKARFGERNLWARLMSSTVFGQIVDTFLFGLVAFSAFTAFLGLEPMMSWGEFGNYLVLGVIYKCLIEWVLLPVTYAVVGALKRREPSYLGGRPSR